MRSVYDHISGMVHLFWMFLVKTPIQADIPHHRLFFIRRLQTEVVRLSQGLSDVCDEPQFSRK